jgi:hypothetical protein
MNWIHLLKSIICFLGVFGLYKYDIWWKINKTENRMELLCNYDKTVRKVKNFGLKIMLVILGILFLVLSFENY